MIFATLVYTIALAKALSETKVVECIEIVDVQKPAICTFQEVGSHIYYFTNAFLLPKKTQAVIEIKNEKDGTAKYILNMFWEQSTRRIKNYISGFLISISSDDHHRMFEFNINTTMLINTEKNVRFVYKKFGEKLNELIFPNTFYLITIKSFSNKEQKVQTDDFLSITVTVPECPSDAFLKKHPINGCRTKKEHKKFIQEQMAYYYDNSYYDEKINKEWLSYYYNDLNKGMEENVNYFVHDFENDI